MTNPFETLVGLKGVTDESPAPTVWINDLPGMSTELVAAVADTEDVSEDDEEGIIATWTRATRLGLERLRSMIEGELSKSADYQPIGAEAGMPTGDESDILILPSANWVGYFVSAPISKDDELFISAMHLDCADEEAVATTVKVFDTKGKDLFTKAITVEPGFNSISIEYAHKPAFRRAAMLLVVIDATALTLRTIGTGQAWACEASEYILEAIASPIVEGEVNNLGSCSEPASVGIMLKAYIRRSLVDVIARHADRLAWGYACIVASVLMTEKLASPNVNLFTNTNRLFTEEYKDELLKDAKGFVMPVARSIVQELKPTPALKADPDFQQGYYGGGFV